MPHRLFRSRVALLTLVVFVSVPSACAPSTARPVATEPVPPAPGPQPPAAQTPTPPVPARISASGEPPAARPAPLPAATEGLDIKFVRDSEEYAALARQTYRLATEAMKREAAGRPAGSWAVVLDVDETVLDNSVYQLDRRSYGLSFESESWNAWVRRREAPPVPGVVPFIREVRLAGGRIAWITNRDEVVGQATQENMRVHTLWSDDDRLCLATSDRAYTKARRRAEVAEGAGACAWTGTKVHIVVYVGDQVGDFPAVGEADADAGRDEAFGRRFFLLPNPMYGGWTSRVTRR